MDLALELGVALLQPIDGFLQCSQTLLSGEICRTQREAKEGGKKKRECEISVHAAFLAEGGIRCQYLTRGRRDLFHSREISPLNQGAATARTGSGRAAEAVVAGENLSVFHLSGIDVP